MLVSLLLIFLTLSTYFYFSFDKNKIILITERFDYAKEHPDEFSQEELDELKKISYKFVSLDQIPQNCVDAVISIEDKNFWTNNGIDIKGMGRLILSSLPFVDLGGGSTISQQVIKMNTDRYYNRNPLDKLKEIIWSYRLNRSFSKEDILERYLNNLYFGYYNYGVQSASLDYFNKNINELNLEECAYLMGIPQIPNLYAPDSKGILTNEGSERKNLVLDAMKNDGFI
jgi:membrane peptidoglycan carboxypeptidase